MSILRPSRPRRLPLLAGLLAAWLATPLLAVGPNSSAPASGPRTLVLAPTLLDSSADEIRSYLGPARFIEELTGHPVAIEGYAGYDEIIRRMADGHIDLAILGPLPYVSLYKTHPQVEPLVRFREADGREFFTCVLVAFADDVRPLPAYVGARLALTQPFSTCGYFSAATIFARAGVDVAQIDYRFIGRHDSIATRIVGGEFDIGVIRDDVAQRFSSVGLVRLGSSQPLPGFTLIANTASLDAATIERIRQGFLNQRSEDLTRFVEWPRVLRQGAVPASHADYQAISQDFAHLESALQRVVAESREARP